MLLIVCLIFEANFLYFCKNETFEFLSFVFLSGFCRDDTVNVNGIGH